MPPASVRTAKISCTIHNSCDLMGKKDYSMSFTSMLHKTRHADYIGLSNFKLLGCSKDKCLC